MLSEAKTQLVRILASLPYLRGDVTKQDIADQLKVSLRTVYTWENDKEVKQEVINEADRSVDEKLLHSILAGKGDAAAINLYFKVRGRFQNPEDAAKVLKMTDTEREEIAFDAHNWLISTGRLQPS